jgi:hypothetical protein
MTSQKLHEMLTRVYLELGLPLQDALRAAEADLKHNSPLSYAASQGRLDKQYFLQSRKALVRALILTPPAGA